jgi:hypothetical protein
MGEVEIQWITLTGGQTIPAYKLVCPQCKALVLGGTTVNTSVEPWRADCGNGHQWDVVSKEDA